VEQVHDEIDQPIIAQVAQFLERRVARSTA